MAKISTAKKNIMIRVTVHSRSFEKNISLPVGYHLLQKCSVRKAVNIEAYFHQLKKRIR